VVSVMVGVFTGGLTGASSITSVEGRLAGGSGDPNYLAAALVPAIMIAVGLANLRRGLIERWALTVAIAIMALGLAATGSRGGLIAAAVALIASCIFLKGRRGQALVWLSLAAIVAGVWFGSTPTAWERITSVEDAGNGRSDLWHVAAQMTGDNPVLGVGLNNYRAVAPDYTRTPGELKYVNLIAERPHFVHNVYLQLAAETGFIGLLLLLGIAFGALRAMHRAGNNFEAHGDYAWAAFARSLLVGTIGMLTAFAFISNGTDQRLWFLLGMGAALYTVSRAPRSSTAPVAADRNGQPSPAAVLERVGAPALSGEGNGHGRPVRAPRSAR
jgi:O-antigen ligase